MPPPPRRALLLSGLALAAIAGAVVLSIGPRTLWHRLTHEEAPPSAAALHAREAHPHDASLRKEHHALLELLPSEDFATHVAVRDGDWLDDATWSAGAPPDEAAIVAIPAERRVRLVGEVPSHVFLVRVDGELVLAAPDGASTELRVDTLFSTPEGTLTLDASTPTDGSIDVVIEPLDIEAHLAAGAGAWPDAARRLYSDGAPVLDTCGGTVPPKLARQVDDGPGVLGRYRWDPEQLSVGLIAHGAVRVAGRAKDAHVALAEPALAGSTHFVLTEAPAGWTVGDRIVVVGTTFVGRDIVTGAYRGSQDELRTIAALDGARIELDRALEFDHATPDDRRANPSAFYVPVANLTRNVTVRSAFDQDLEQLDANAIGAEASRLGHVMFMHTADVAVSYARFSTLGRTNKNDVADDFRRRDFDGLDSPRISAMPRVSAAGTPLPPAHVTNPRGRYALHLHRAGATASDATATVVGSVVTGGPSWGFVSHSSRADLTANVAFGVLGAAFVAETGNETGRWERNVAINTYGAAFNDPVLDPRGAWRFENDDMHQTLLLEKRGAWRNHDFGHFGNGFWFQGKLIDAVANVAASSGLCGFFYMFRAPDQIAVDPAVLDEPLSVHDPAGIHPVAPGLNVFVDDVSIADRCGLTMIGLGGGRMNDERSVIDRFVAWEVGQIGTYAQYYPGYTLRDSTFLASASPDAHALAGVSFLKVLVDVVLSNLTIEGFPQQYELKKSWSPGSVILHGYEDPYLTSRAAIDAGEDDPLRLGYAHVLIDAGFDASEASDERHMGSTYRPEDTILTSSELVPGRFDVKLDDASLRIDLDLGRVTYGSQPDDPIRPTLHEGAVFLLAGTKTDSVGSIPFPYHNNVLAWTSGAIDHRLATQGYHRMPSGDVGIVLEEVLADRYTGEKHVVRFVAALDPRWDLGGATDNGPFDPAAHPDVYVPGFLRAP